ncbi:hypothetical protein [Nocardia sp. CC201C]|uniref:hypothetical protein n=1 Tax=Nocardia sp. CC201C TaxID=3044575 RepID=UPI0024A802D2|nr:hypothetical protein [Nocardia sp. CC201C]
MTHHLDHRSEQPTEPLPRYDDRSDLVDELVLLACGAVFGALFGVLLGLWLMGGIS